MLEDVSFFFPEYIYIAMQRSKGIKAKTCKRSMINIDRMTHQPCALSGHKRRTI